MLVNAILILIYCILLFCKIYLLEKFGSIGIQVSRSLTLNLSLYFISGSVLASLKFESCKFKSILLTFVFLCLFLSFYFLLFYVLQFILVPLFVLLVGISSTNYLNSISYRIGDISYGIYIYSFPIQVTLMYFFKLNTWQLMTTSIFLSILIGFFSWHLIEKNALKYKNVKFSALYKIGKKVT